MLPEASDVQGSLAEQFQDAGPVLSKGGTIV